MAPLRRARRAGRLPRPRARRRGAIGENTLSYGNPLGTHDTRGWPTLKDWPHHASLTHEQSYYKWLERSYRSGLRVFVNLLVDNEVLCTIYPYKSHGCNEMDGVRLQATRIRQLQDYIDAQNGGPGKGWFRIVTTPAQARRVANQGKLAVVLGIEVSKLFDCGVQDDQPECTEAQIDKQLDEVYKLGVRDMELVNKFDNALGGVAGDTGTTGVVVNAGNRIETGRFWQMGPCADAHNHDKTQPTDPTAPDRDALAGNVLNALLPPGALPLYGPGAALQRPRPLQSRRVPGPPDDAEEDDHRPRPPERARPPAAARRRRVEGLLGDRLLAQLEHARRDPAHLPPRRRRDADGRLEQGVRRRSGRTSRRSATRASTGASAGART